MQREPGQTDRGHSFVTTTQLLHELSSPGNDAAWRTFVERYRPVILGYIRRSGVGAADLEDVAQQVLAEFARGLTAGTYQRGKGRLRAWMFGIARNQVRLWRRTHGRASVDPNILEATTDGVESDPIWEREWDDHVLRRCMAMLREAVTEQTLEAFILFALDGHPAETVSLQLGMTPNAVFGAKRRVLAKLQEFREQIDRDE